MNEYKKKHGFFNWLQISYLYKQDEYRMGNVFLNFNISFITFTLIAWYVIYQVIN